MIPDKMLEVLKHEGVVAIVSQGKEGPHVINTWNSYLTITSDERIIGPVGKMNKTESNVKENSAVLVTLGSREVQGFNSKGTGFLIKGAAAFVYQGDEFNEIKQRFPWARAVLQIKPESITQTL
jgi:flavin reductase (DIM6/NTAB) family NADH-FMN oxidoreductase RutF